MITSFVNQRLELWIDNMQIRDGYGPMTCISDLEVYRLHDDRFRFFPTATGDYSITIRAAGYEHSTTIRVIDPMTGAEPSRNLVIVGDSGAGADNGNGFPRFIKEYFLGTPLNLVGSRGVAPYKHDGDPGASYDTWRNDAARSVLIDDGTGAIDIPAYISLIGATPDAWLWTCGSNRVGNSTFELLDSTINSEHDFLDELIAAIRVVSPTSKHIIAEAWPGNIREQPWIDVYGGNLNRFDWKRKHHRYVEMTRDRYAGREAEGLYVAPTSAQIDTYRHYPAEDPFHYNGLLNGGHGQVARSLAPLIKRVLWP